MLDDLARIGDCESKYVDAGGLRTHYLEAGEGDPAILIHGGGPGADAYGNWKSCLPVFAESFKVFAVDMLGFGRTAKPDPESFSYSPDARAQHLIDFIEALGLKKVRLIGNSMGGMAALGVCMKRPDLIDGLVLMGAAGIKPQGALPEALAPLMQFDGTHEAMRKVIGVLVHDGFEIDEQMVDYRLAVANQPETRAALAATMRWVADHQGLYYDEEDIRRVQTPTLVVAGKDDPIITLRDNYRFLELLDNSWGYFIPHCGHWVMIEYPEQFTKITTSFFKQ